MPTDFRMPAEWEPHEATWLSWPKDPVTFPEDILPQVEKVYIQMISALAGFEKVNLLIDDAATEKRVKKLLPSENVFIHKIPTVDVWMRDYGPSFVKIGDRNIAGINWDFNAWGNKYKELKEDTVIPSKISKITGIKMFKPKIVLEGGSIDVNGAGAVLTTEQCLLNKNRNPHLNKDQIEGHLKKWLGVKKVLWLKDGIVGDDTDGHIDDIARFVSPRHVLCCVEDNANDTNYKALKENFRLLKSFHLDVAPLPMPGTVNYKGRRLPASYANFYIANKIVLAPIYGHKNDSKAIRILQKHFPNRTIVPIRCEALVAGFGSIHCVTQQQPKCKT